MTLFFKKMHAPRVFITNSMNNKVIKLNKVIIVDKKYKPDF